MLPASDLFERRLFGASERFNFSPPVRIELASHTRSQAHIAIQASGSTLP